jgi:LacI family transcriptional regulator
VRFDPPSPESVEYRNDRPCPETSSSRKSPFRPASIGGGNNAVLAAFADAGRICSVFVAHDLDADNARLLREGRISVVLHHDLRQDMRATCRHIMQAQGALREVPVMLSPVQVITPFNLPPPVL